MTLTAPLLVFCLLCGNVPKSLLKFEVSSRGGGSGARLWLQEIRGGGASPVKPSGISSRGAKVKVSKKKGGGASLVG